MNRWCGRQESNLYCGLRRPVSYPLEDGRLGMQDLQTAIVAV